MNLDLETLSIGSTLFGLRYLAFLIFLDIFAKWESHVRNKVPTQSLEVIEKKETMPESI